MRIWAALIIVASSMALALGLLLPIMELKRLFVFTDTPSILGIVGGLFGRGDIALGLIIAIASIVFPVAKLLALNVLLVISPDHDGKNATVNRAIALISLLTKWSMLDVMVVALVVFAAKTSGLATAVSKPGLWLFGFSVLGSAIAAQIIARILKKDSAETHKTGQ